MSYVNFGSNWGGKSANNNLLDIFKKYSVVFSGLDDVNRVKKYLSYNYEIGTKIIVTDGKKNIAVAVSTSKFNSLDKLNIHFEKEDKKRFGINGTVLAVKVKLFELDEYDKNFDFFLAQPNRFCNIKNEKDKNHIDKLLKKYSGELAMEELKSNCIRLLKNNYNLILTGAPGTGKTYLAKEIAKEIMKDNENIKDYKEFIKEYYNKNKGRLDDLKKQGDKLREEFIKKFPIESLKNISIDDYAVGRGDNNSFCYWIEFGLDRKLLDNFSIGDSTAYILYYDKKTGNLVNKTGKDNNEVIKEIGKELYNMATIEDYDFKDSIIDFNKRNYYFAIKIYNTYHPHTYFPAIKKEDIFNICNVFDIEKDNNMYKLYKNIKKFFDENFKDIDLYIIKIILENIDLISGKKQNINMMNNNDYGFVQFHPSYDYTDFVEGLRPIKDSSGNIGFERKDGVFKEFCKEALKNRSSKFVFIIDEINRGEISKIFGELFFAIDRGYRGEKGRVKTQYNNLINNDESNEDDEFEDGFFVPENVYIIGTMNDIDRSVESMDFAMRRRFAWKEVKAIDTQYILDTMFNDNKEIEEKDKQLFIDEAKKRMDNLNDAIEKIDGFNSSYHIGASYFLKLKNYYKSSSDNKETAFKSLWENHLKGLLFEYLRGMPDINDRLKKLENAYNMLSDNNTEQDTNDNKQIIDKF